MPSLIAFRRCQGLGAGAIIPIVQTVVGDIYSVEERSRVQGYTASVWGIASVIGPLIGGGISQYTTWRWIFFVNIPFATLALVLLARHLKETVVRKNHQIDYAGSAIMAVGLSALIFGLLQGGVVWPWSSHGELLVLAVAVVVLCIFGLVERHAAEPIIPKWVVTHRPLLAANLANVSVGAVQYGLTAYVPAYAEGVRGVSPLLAGLPIAAVLFGWPISSALSGRLYLRFGFRTTGLVGAGLCLIGAMLYPTLGPDSSVFVVGLFGFCTGIGLGFVATPMLVASQSLVGREQRGVVTASNLFSRSIGSALGIAIIGSVAN